MKNNIIIAILISISVCLTAQNTSDVIQLKNGSILIGKIVHQIPNHFIKIELRGTTVFIYDMNEVQSINGIVTGGQTILPTDSLSTTIITQSQSSSLIDSLPQVITAPLVIEPDTESNNLQVQEEERTPPTLSIKERNPFLKSNDRKSRSSKKKPNLSFEIGYTNPVSGFLKDAESSFSLTIPFTTFSGIKDKPVNKPIFRLYSEASVAFSHKAKFLDSNIDVKHHFYHFDFLVGPSVFYKFNETSGICTYTGIGIGLYKAPKFKIDDTTVSFKPQWPFLYAIGTKLNLSNALSIGFQYQPLYDLTFKGKITDGDGFDQDFNMATTKVTLGIEF